MMNGTMPSLADIAAVTNNNDNFGGNNGWWVIILLFAIFGGWGNAGYAYGGGGAGAGANYVLSSDFATLQRQIDTLGSDLKTSNVAIGNGISSLGYDQLSQMNGINNNIAASTNSLTAQMTALGSQLQQCCCDNRAEIAQVKYDMATQTCATQRAISDAAQQIIQNDNANYRALHDENVANAMAAKDDRIAALTAQVNALQLAASQSQQNEYLLSQLKGCGCGGCC